MGLSRRALVVSVDQDGCDQGSQTDRPRDHQRVLVAGVDRGELPAGADRAEVIDALIGAYWARAWAIEGFPGDWSSRLVEAVLNLVAA